MRRIHRVEVSKVESMVVLAEHCFVSCLSLIHYTIDQFALYKGTLLCQCGSYNHEHASILFGWYNYREPRWLDRLLDSVLGYDEWPLQKIKEVGHESVEVKRNRNMLKSDACTGYCVFIPTQRHLTCNLDDFCVPSIATTKKEIMFIFTTANMISCWKVEEWTCSLKFWEHKKPTLNYDGILAVWLVVSYRLLCNGPQSLLQVPKASFMLGHALACMRWGFN